MSDQESGHQDDATAAAAAAAAALPSSYRNSSNEQQLLMITPSGLFLVLNLMIFTIALSSKLSNRKTTSKNHHQEDEDEDQFPAAAAEAGNFQFQQFRYQQQEHVSNVPDQNIMSPPPTNPTTTFDSYDQIPKPAAYNKSSFRRVKSDVVVRRPKLRKSWSSCVTRSSSDYNNNKEDNEEEEDAASVEKRRPSTSTMRDHQEEVDAMADDFINRFKHQLKLQRMDSFSRYRSNTPTPTPTPT